MTPVQNWQRDEIHRCGANKNDSIQRHPSINVVSGSDSTRNKAPYQTAPGIDSEQMKSSPKLYKG